MKIEEFKTFEYVCQDVRELLFLYAVWPEETTFDEQTETAKHLQTCPECKSRFLKLKQIAPAIRNDLQCLVEMGVFQIEQQFSSGRNLTHEEIMEIRFEAQLERAYIRRRRRERREKIAKIKQWAKPVVAIAACLVLAIGLFFRIQSVNKPQDDPSLIAANLQQNPVQIELITGSTTESISAGQSIIASAVLKVLRINGNRQMVLNVGTALKIEPYNLGCRVKLDHGEIYTEVEHDGKPFIVETIHGRAVITGTTFNIKTDNERMALAVVEGTVRFESDKGKIEVRGGSQSVIAAGRKPTEPVFCDTGSIARWAKQKHLPELPSVASPRMDVTDLPGAISFLSQSYNLEEIDFDIWIEQHREWFEREFPWTKRMQRLLAEEGIQVDTIQLLIESGDLWRFAWPEYSSTRMLGQTNRSVQALSEKYQIDGSDLTSDREHNQQLYGSEALDQWLNAIADGSPSSTMNSMHAAVFLLQTRSLAWFAVKTGQVQVSEPSRVLDLMSEQVRIASHSNDILNRLLLADNGESVCSETQVKQYTNDLKSNIAFLIEIEKVLEGILE